MRAEFSLSAAVAGLVAVIVSYAGPSLVIFQAASAAGLDEAHLASWIWAVSIGSGVSAAVLSWWSRAPIVTAWSTPGAALLVAGLPGVAWSEAVGAFLIAGVLIAALGASGLFESLMKRVPPAIAAAMLAGILFRFGAQIFGAFAGEPMLVGAMVVVWAAVKRVSPRWAIAAVLVAGMVLAAGLGRLRLDGFAVALASPVWTTPSFSLATTLSLALPLAMVTLTGQFVPGIAVLRASGYATPAGPLVWATSLAGAVLAPFGAHGVNLAAITAAICSGPEAHVDPGKRWVAGFVLGLVYVTVGLFGATLAGVFAALPAALVATVAGLALLGAIQNGLVAALGDVDGREPALLTFLVTASGTAFLGIGSAFWGLAVGLLAHAWFVRRRPCAA